MLSGAEYSTAVTSAPGNARTSGYRQQGPIPQGEQAELYPSPQGCPHGQAGLTGASPPAAGPQRRSQWWAAMEGFLKHFFKAGGGKQEQEKIMQVPRILPELWENCS